VHLRLGASLDPDNIAEGNDVYFECTVTAKPKVYKVVWLHNVSEMHFSFRSSAIGLRAVVKKHDPLYQNMFFCGVNSAARELAHQ
jgi:hypothetical protein